MGDARGMRLQKPAKPTKAIAKSGWRPGPQKSVLEARGRLGDLETRLAQFTGLETLIVCNKLVGILQRFHSPHGIRLDLRVRNGTIRFRQAKRTLRQLETAYAAAEGLTLAELKERMEPRRIPAKIRRADK